MSRGTAGRQGRAAAAIVAACAAGALLAGCGGSSGGTKGSADAAASATTSPPSAGGAPELSFTDPYIPLPAGGSMAAGYLVITNSGGTADALLGASSPVAKSVSLHTEVGDTMKPLARLAVPAHGKGVVARLGNHLMFEGLKRKLRVGESVPVTLRFARSGSVPIRMTVRPIDYRPPASVTAGGSDPATAPGSSMSPMSTMSGMPSMAGM